MRYVPLGDTGLDVSELCFGTMTFGGEGCGFDTAEAIYQRCRETGINFFDCANVYVKGESEKILGRLIKPERDKLIITTKLGMGGGFDASGPGYSRAHIMHHVEQSLRRLDTDYIDVYFLHKFHDQPSLEEVMRALDDLVRQGKVRYPAASNFAAWQVAKANTIARERGGSGFKCIQPMYSLLKRQAEVELLPMAQSEGVGVITYSPLAGGILSGKYGDKNLEVDGRLKESEPYRKRYADRLNYEVARSLGEIAKQQGCHPVSLAVAWVAAHPGVTAPIIGARNMMQLEPALASLDVTMSDALYHQLASLTPAPPLATDREEERSSTGGDIFDPKR